MSASPDYMTLSALARALGAVRYRYSSEVQLHELMEQVIASAGFEAVREHILDRANRADFWLDGLVIEVKVDGTMSEALRQVDRYIHLPQVRGVLLAATPSWAAQALKQRPQWQGKPFQMARLQRQAL